MVRLLNWLTNLLMARRKKPWARFIVNGISDDGQVRFDISYNKAFIKNIQANGLQGASDEESVQNFLFGTMMLPKEIFEEEDFEPVASDAHPFLQAEDNKFKRG